MDQKLKVKQKMMRYSKTLNFVNEMWKTGLEDKIIKHKRNNKFDLIFYSTAII